MTRQSKILLRGPFPEFYFLYFKYLYFKRIFTYFKFDIALI